MLGAWNTAVMQLHTVPQPAGQAFRFHEAGEPGVPVDPARPVLVWLHGWARTHADWLRLQAEFPGWRHLSVDAPGFGTAPPPPAAWGPQDYADALLSELATLAAPPYVLIGHSFGCRVSLCAAASAPDRIAALFLIAAPGLRRPRSFAWHLRAAGLRWLGRLARATGQHGRFSARFGSPDYRAAGVLRPTFVKVINTDLGEVAGRVRCPTTFVYGARDSETPPLLGTLFRQRIPHARVEVIPGAGHLDPLAGFAVATAGWLRQLLSTFTAARSPAA